MTAAMPERRPATEEISGVMERVTFHNDDSGFCVLRVKTKGHREETTVVGSLPSVTAGEWLVAAGCWVRDRGKTGCNSKPALSCVREAISRSPTLRDVPQQYKNF
jgi:hypothetical protein